MGKQIINAKNIVLAVAYSLGLKRNKVAPESKLVDLGVDMRSYADLYQLGLDLSNIFGVSVPDDVLEKLVMVQDVIDALIPKCKHHVITLSSDSLFAGRVTSCPG